LRNEANIIKYQLAVAELRNSDDRLKLAHAVRHLGDAYYYAGEKRLAKPHYVEALSIYRNHDDRRPLDFANALRSYAVLQADLGATDEAKSLWQEAHDLYLLLDVQAGVAESAARLAILALRENDFRRSREWLAEASEAVQIANDAETSRFVAEVKDQIDAS
jgi:tetratricopeptide (TPR) repeat protein